MPTPLEILLDPVSLTFSGIYLLLMIWEALFPARKLPYVHFWQIKGIASYVFFLLLSTYLPMAYATWLPSTALIDLSSMNVAVATVVGVLVYELGIYLWHRLMHSNNVLWRVFHQMHHSAERLDTFGAFFFSPMDMIGFTLLGTLCISILIGMPPVAVTLFLLITNFFNVFQHANIKTPVWLGYLIQRPESHSVHHAKGVHAYNYSDLPLFDMLFGTFKNPSAYANESGFYQGASAKIKEMILFKNINKPLIVLLFASASVAAQNIVIEKSISLSTGVELNYVEAGEPGAIPIIMLHGYTDSWRSFEKVLPMFSDSYYVAALTHRGHGSSSKPKTGYELENFAKDVVAFIEQKNLGKCIIVGHSFGGLVAQQLAIQHPTVVRALVLLSTCPSFEDNAGIPEFINDVYKLSDPVPYDFASAFQYGSINKSVDSTEMKIFIQESLKLPSFVWKAIGQLLLKTDLIQYLEAIQVPTLILWGNRDQFCSGSDQIELATGISLSVVKIYKDVGHAIHWEDRNRFVNDVKQFVLAVNLK